MPTTKKQPIEASPSWSELSPHPINLDAGQSFLDNQPAPTPPKSTGGKFSKGFGRAFAEVPGLLAGVGAYAARMRVGLAWRTRLANCLMQQTLARWQAVVLGSLPSAPGAFLWAGCLTRLRCWRPALPAARRNARNELQLHRRGRIRHGKSRRVVDNTTRI